MRRDMLSSTESHRLGRGMRLTRDIIIRYKGVLGVNAGQVINKNDEAWEAFYELLDLRKQGRLLPFTRKVSPLGYWKDRDTY
jgi:hypothetical protein